MANGGLSARDFQPNFGGIAAVTDAALRTRARNEEIAGLKSQFGTEDTGQAIAARNAQTTAIELIRETKDMSAENANEFFESFNPMLKQFGLNLSKNPEIGHIITVDKRQEDGTFSREHQGIDRAGNTFELDTGQIASHELGLEQAAARRAAAQAGADPTKVLALTADRILSMQDETAKARAKITAEPKSAGVTISKWFSPDEFTDPIKALNAIDANLNAMSSATEAIRVGQVPRGILRVSRQQLVTFQEDHKVDADDPVEAMELMRRGFGMKGIQLMFEGFGPTFPGLTDDKGRPLVPGITKGDIAGEKFEDVERDKGKEVRAKGITPIKATAITKTIARDADKRLTAIESREAEVAELSTQTTARRPNQVVLQKIANLQSDIDKLRNIDAIDQVINQLRSDMANPTAGAVQRGTIARELAKAEQKKKQLVNNLRG